MKRFVVAAVLAISVASLLGATTASAWGWGPSLRYAYHNGTYTEIDDEDDVDYEANIASIGLQYDTNVARDELINYRAEIAVEIIRASVEYDEPSSNIFNPLNQATLDQDVKGVGVGINQTLGFGLVRNNDIRLYLGPTLRIGIWEGSSDDSALRDEDVDYTGVDIGLGPELGINFHLNDSVSLSTAISYVAGVGILDVSDPRRRFTTSRKGYTYVDYNHRASIGFSILFRSADDVFGK